ncbi:hypothetical protein BDW02DRAFT_554104 [Decorospora gaudefroyi]|uniref:Uncharacterized protein n=1 Tax=Decorospora gaudefroyi TaxID=184978 RepID=A0A6A5K9S2_9PLEO|nr:hypothetical protein BDW02DRAFT_554104 [Decorospora gaudefroyi]
MTEVQGAMVGFQNHVQKQKDDNKPLYKWTKFDGYRHISRALTCLDGKALNFEPIHLPAAHVKMCLDKATHYSLSVSQIAVFAMGVMSEKTASCIDEIEESALSAEGKVNAQTRITKELKRLLKHCATATDRVYAALDLLRQGLLIDDWVWTAVGLLLGAATSATIGIAVAYLYGSTDFALALKANPEGMHAEVLDLVRRNQAVTNLTGEIYSIKLDGVTQRCQALEDASESHGLRIDNLVDALGVPNEEGTYFSTSPKATPEQCCDVPQDIRSHIQKIADNADLQIGRLHQEMQQMRKNMNRMDIRLMKRLDKVDRYGL